MTTTAETIAPVYERDGITLYCENCLNVFNAVDLYPIRTVIADPPWVRFDYAQHVTTGQTAWSVDKETEWQVTVLEYAAAWMPRIRNLTERTLGRTWLLTSVHYWPTYARLAQVLAWPMPHVWRAPNRDGVLICFGQGLPQGAPRLIQAAYDRAPQCPRQSVEFMTELLIASDAGPLLDPFCGDGAALVAAKQLGWTATGIDVCEKRIAKAIEALNT